MFNIFLSLSEVIPLLTFIFGSFAGHRAGQLVYRQGSVKLRRSLGVTLTLLALAGIGVLGLIFLTAGLATYGWVFASNRVVVALPPLVAATAVALAWSLPRIVRLRRRCSGESTSPLRAELRFDASDPRLVVPVQAVGIAGLLSSYNLVVQRPVPPYISDVLAINGLLAVAFGLLWLRQLRRQRIMSGSDARRRPGVGVRLVRTITALGVIAALVAVSAYAAMNASKLAPSYDMSVGENMDYGGGPAMGDHHAMPHSRPGSHGHSTPDNSNLPDNRSVADLTGGDDIKGQPDRVFTLTAEKKRIVFASGRVVDALTFNGQVPGPELRVRQGDLVQVTLVNKIPGIGVTLHWHGLDVPNAQDGVPGVTQNAVQTGQSHTYRFRAHQVGTFWYHSHQDAFRQVDRGLYGALVSLPRSAKPEPYDFSVTVHDWKMLKANPYSRSEPRITFDTADVLSRRAIPAGSKVRLRLINTGPAAANDERTPTFILTGVPFRVAATDGNEVHQPGELPSGTRLRIGTGGRADLTFTMPDRPVRLTAMEDPTNGLALSPDGKGTAPTPDESGLLFDRAHYGTPTPTAFSATSQFDRNFTMIFDDGPGFYDGRFEARVTVNGEVFPKTPMFMVRQGDLVKMTLVGRGHVNHPFHLHGHRVLVLSHNGQPVTGSPWWTDTLEVRVGDIYEVAFRADNPGIWMDHCHNLQHSSKGMVTHLGYEGVTTPYRAGHATGNMPEASTHLPKASAPRSPSSGLTAQAATRATSLVDTVNEAAVGLSPAASTAAR
ncbi:multicopper oxidase family protein [Actinopolymorpha alba]|uniref:multicopper oxidase family protein n=1 Tax=Actinopolymorpha alba TaxID=533267 RepID=UPI000379CAC2|nr:multicopper oxidase family protein [Actinopolymorpha alba]